MARVIVLIVALVCQSFPGWMASVCTPQCPQTASKQMDCCGEQEQGEAACACCAGNEAAPSPMPSPAAPSHDHRHDQRPVSVLAVLTAQPECPSACCSVRTLPMRATPAAVLIGLAGAAPIAVIPLPKPVYEPPDVLAGSTIRSAMRDGSPPREPGRHRALLNIWTI